MAEAFLLAQVEQQAAIEGVSFTRFEQVLLRDLGNVTGAELDEYEEEHGEEFWAQLSVLIKNARTRLNNDGGDTKAFDDAVQLTAERGSGYLAGILAYERFVHTRSRKYFWDNKWADRLALIATGTALVAALVIAIVYIPDPIELLKRSKRASAAVEALVGFCERYGLAALVAAVLSSWVVFTPVGQKVATLLTRRRD